MLLYTYATWYVLWRSRVAGVIGSSQYVVRGLMLNDLEESR